MNHDTQSKPSQPAPAFGFNTSKMCSLVVEDGQANLYMPDGTKIPDQISTHIVQSLDQAVNRPRLATARVTLLVKLADSAPTTELTGAAAFFDEQERKEGEGD